MSITRPETLLHLNMERLTEPSLELIDGDYTNAQPVHSLLDQLEQARINGIESAQGGTSSTKSRPPMDLTVTALQQDIRDTCTTWLENWSHAPTGDLAHRVKQFCAAARVDANATTIALNSTGEWIHRIEQLLHPPRTSDVPGQACATCGQEHHWEEQDGEKVRVGPALTITARGVTCRACGEHLDYHQASATYGVAT